MLIAQLTGGLGNQLFTYARLATYARDNNLSLRLDGSVTERILAQSPDLFDFNLNKEEQVSESDYGVFRTQVERALWRSEISRRTTRRFQDSHLGNQGTLPTNLNNWKVRGFFQDYHVAETFLEVFGKSPLTLKYESKALLDITDEISAELTLGVHLRRGDYLSYKDSFGVLNDDYYTSALKRALLTTAYKKVLVFSDSPELVADFCKKSPIPATLIGKDELSTSENLILMSRCQGLITSNSTYSFWAAMLAGHKNIIIPKPWFKSDEKWLNSSNLSNPKWLFQESRWLN